MMSLDILYKSVSSYENAGHMNKRTVYHLCLDKSFQLFFPDLKRSHAFFDILTRPLTSREDILFRQDIFKDFLNNAGLFDKLMSVYSSFKSENGGYQQMKATAYGGFGSTSGNPEVASSILQINASFLKKTILYINELYKLLSDAELISEGLIRIRDDMGALVGNEVIPDAIRFLSQFEGFSVYKNTDYKIDIASDGSVCGASLIDEKYVKHPLTEPKGFFSFLKKQKEEPYPFATVAGVDSEFYRNIVSGAIVELSSLFESYTSQLYDKYIKVYNQLFFYEIGLKYHSRLMLYGAQCIFPHITDTKGFFIKNALDMLLVFKDQSAEKVVPNDMEAENDKDGILIFGENGSGKTVFLRSVASIQVLSQAGLPVPCESASIFPYSSIHTQFSEGEKMFVKGNEAGRFEQEVSEIAEMVDNLSESSLIILNETFQTTSYDEGAEGLSHILKYFTEKNVMWILVTHLTQMKDIYSKENARFLHTDGTFKVIPD